MNRRVAMLFLCVLATFSYLALSPCSASDPLPVSCSPDTPAVFVGESTKLRVWANNRDGEPLYDWSASGGKLRGTGSEVTWDMSGVAAGTYTVTANVSYPAGDTRKCLIQVLVQPRADRGGTTAWYLLRTGEKEKAGYGLYSYILFGSRPTEANRERYRMVIKAYIQVIESIADLQARGVSPGNLNATYYPVTESPPKGRPSEEWLLENYDFPTARAILSSLPGEYRSGGPYIVSHRTPLGPAAPPSGKLLFQDLSSCEPRMVEGYARAFFNQAAQERHWEENTVNQLALKLQNTIAVMGRAYAATSPVVIDLLEWKKRGQ